MTRRLVITLVGLVVLVPRLARADTCVVRGTSVTLEGGTVRPKGEPAFELGIIEVAAIATLPTRCGGRTVLEVTTPIAMRIERENIWMNLSRDVTTADGVVTLKHGASVIDACVVGDRVLATVATSSNDILPGENKRPDSFIRNVEIPCDALTLDRVDNDADDFLMPMSADATDHGFELRNPNRTSVTLRAQPNVKARGVRYEEPNCNGGCIQLHEIRGQKGWVLVETGGEGALVRGWVHRSELKAVPDMAWMAGYGCYGDHRGGERFEVDFGTKNYVEREGTVTAGTKIYTSGGTGEWGRFTTAPHVKVRIENGSSWAQLRVVPGIDGSYVGLNGVVLVTSLKLDPTP